MKQQLIDTAKLQDWQTRYWLTNITRGEVIAEIEADPTEWNGHATVHKFTAELLNISERQSQRELKAYRTLHELLPYADTDEKVLKLQQTKEAVFRAIPADTDPAIAMMTLMEVSTAKEVADSLKQNDQMVAETEAKLKADTLKRAKDAEARTAQQKAEREAQKAEREAKRAERKTEAEKTAQPADKPTPAEDEPTYFEVEYGYDIKKGADRAKAEKLHRHIDKTLLALMTKIAELKAIDPSVCSFSMTLETATIEVN